MTKVCTTCKINKPITDFSSHPLGKFGVRSKCKLCSTEASKKYNNKHKEERKQYYLNNKEKLLKQHKEYHLNNKEHIQKQTKDYRGRKDKQIKNQQKQWRKTHKSFIKNKEKWQLKNNIYFKLVFCLRRRLNIALKNNQKSGHTLELLGCSIKKLKKHLESQFKEGMTWDNYSFYGWHVDHIIPCAKFDLSKESEQKKCFNYTNLQPLWMQENLKKGAK
jgi:hypothetical protein